MRTEQAPSYLNAALRELVCGRCNGPTSLRRNPGAGHGYLERLDSPSQPRPRSVQELVRQPVRNRGDPCWIQGEVLQCPRAVAAAHEDYPVGALQRDAHLAQSPAAMIKRILPREREIALACASHSRF